MAVIVLPVSQPPRTAQITLLDFAGVQRSPLGGETQVIDRLGGRYRIEVQLPVMRRSDTAMAWIGALLRGRRKGVRMRVPLGAGTYTAGGSPFVGATNQTGETLLIQGVPTNTVIKAGQPFSVFKNNRHYLFYNAVDVIADSFTQAYLQVEPMLRTDFAYNTPVHLAQPMIEGFLTGDAASWTWEQAKTVGLSFGVEEYG